MDVNMTNSAAALVKAENMFRETFDTWQDGLPAMDEDQFWVHAIQYRDAVDMGVRHGGEPEGDPEGRLCELWDAFLRTSPSAMACPEHGDGKERSGPERWDRCRVCAVKTFARFAKTYEDVSARLYQPLDGVIDARGDDRYGDLLDAFPILGRVVYNRVIAGKDSGLSSEADLRLYAEDNFGDEIARHVFDGENYHRMRLKEKAMEIAKRVYGNVSFTASTAANGGKQ